ncbi:MAG: B12-binding domain-containing radical SAM protein [Planctomycetota bacterium]
MNIALVAMSGIRACDAELLELGLTLPGFVERSKTIAALPSLGLLTLAGMTPSRHRVRYLELTEVCEGDELPGDFDLVAISSFSAQIGEGYVLARRLTDRGVPVVMGGLHVTSVPEETAACGASAAIGEGEIIWPEILRDAERGRLEPIYDARGREFDLADAPLPAFELLDIENYNRLTVQTSRGCPWRCSFCASSILLTRRYKQKPIAKVLREVDKIREMWPRPFIELADDNAFVNRAYWHKLLPQLAARRVKWFAETDLSVSEDDQLLRAMRRAGCAEVLIGFESPVKEGLDGIELRQNWKKRQWSRYKRVIDRIQSQGIRVNACFVLGLDGHTTDVFRALYDFVEDTGPFDVQITYPTPFPGTPLYQGLKREGRLTHDGQWQRYTLFDINYRPTPMTAEQLRGGFHELTGRLYGEPFTKWRRENFNRKYLRRWLENGDRPQVPLPVEGFRAQGHRSAGSGTGAGEQQP